LLTEEISCRYEYQEGRVKASLKKDVQFDKAIEVLKNKDEYFAILKGITDKTDSANI